MARGPHSCLEVVWKLSGKCLVLGRRFYRRMRVSGMCQEVVWEVSGVRNEKSKAVAGRPLIGSLRGVVQGRPGRVAGGRFRLGLRTADKGPGVGSRYTQLAGSCLEVV